MAGCKHDACAFTSLQFLKVRGGLTLNPRKNNCLRKARSGFGRYFAFRQKLAKNTNKFNSMPRFSISPYGCFGELMQPIVLFASSHSVALPAYPFRAFHVFRGRNEFFKLITMRLKPIFYIIYGVNLLRMRLFNRRYRKCGNDKTEKT